jgi:hypothetical protein
MKATFADAVCATCDGVLIRRFLPSHMTNGEISEALFLSVNTVKTHLRSAYRKLVIRSRRDAIAPAAASACCYPSRRCREGSPAYTLL